MAGAKKQNIGMGIMAARAAQVADNENDRLHRAVDDSIVNARQQNARV